METREGKIENEIELHTPRNTSVGQNVMQLAAFQLSRVRSDIDFVTGDIFGFYSVVYSYGDTSVSVF